jgi:hypothetical protein
VGFELKSPDTAFPPPFIRGSLEVQEFEEFKEPIFAAL